MSAHILVTSVHNLDTHKPTRFIGYGRRSSWEKFWSGYFKTGGSFARANGICSIAATVETSFFVRLSSKESSHQTRRPFKFRRKQRQCNNSATGSYSYKRKGRRRYLFHDTPFHTKRFHVYKSRISAPQKTKIKTRKGASYRYDWIEPNRIAATNE